MSGLSSIIGGLTGANGVKDAARGAKAENDRNANTTRDANNALLQPFEQGGQAAGNNILALLGVGGDPTAAAQAYQQFKDSTGFQSQLDTGLNGVAQNSAFKGALNSGAALKGGIQYGEGLDQQSFGNYLSQLGQQQNLGYNASTANVGSNQNILSTLTGNTDNAAQAFADSSTANSKYWSDLLKSLFSGAGQKLGGMPAGGQSSYGAPSTAASAINPAAFASTFGKYAIGAGL